MDNMIKSCYIAFLLNEMKLNKYGGTTWFKCRYDTYWFHIKVAAPDFATFIHKYCCRGRDESKH